MGSGGAEKGYRIPAGKGPHAVGCTDLMTGDAAEVRLRDEHSGRPWSAAGGAAVCAPAERVSIPARRGAARSAAAALSRGSADRTAVRLHAAPSARCGRGVPVWVGRAGRWPCTASAALTARDEMSRP